MPAARAPKGASLHKSTLHAQLLTLLSQFLKMAGGLALVPISLRYLGRQEYGLWIVLQSLGNYVMFSDLGIAQTVMNFVSVHRTKGDYDGVSRTMTTAFGVSWMVMIALWAPAAIIILTQPVDKWLLKDPVASGPFRLYMFLFVTLTLMRVPMLIFQASQRGVWELRLRQLLDCGAWILNPLAIVLVLVLGGKILSLVIVSNLLMIVLGALDYLFLVRRHPGARLARRFWDAAQVPVLLSTSVFFLLNGFGIYAQRLAGNILAGRFGSLAQVPDMFVLLMAARVVSWVLADSISRTVQPYLMMLQVQGRSDRLRFFARLSTHLTFSFAVAYSALLYLLAKPMLALWVGSGFFLGYKALAYLIGAFLIEALFMSTNNCMIAVNRHRGVGLAMVFYAALSLACGIAGAMWWEPANPLEGICLGFFVAALLGEAGPLSWLANSWLEGGWRSYYRDFLRRPLSLGLIGALDIVVCSAVGFEGLWARAMCVAATVAVLALAIWRQGFEGDEHDWLRELAVRVVPGWASAR